MSTQRRYSSSGVPAVDGDYIGIDHQANIILFFNSDSKEKAVLVEW
jgi:hypothetical protein